MIVAPENNYRLLLLLLSLDAFENKVNSLTLKEFDGNSEQFKLLFFTLFLRMYCIK